MARLGGLLPLVVCHHLRRALQHEQSARLKVEQFALPVAGVLFVLVAVAHVLVPQGQRAASLFDRLQQPT
ncbi:hypothetical protein ABT382_24860 [Streptomyces pharetrae]|uniref:hypothetical protein n=1 Tax=Streptomyces pharetrae TaxID=291370 RepID=UPI0033539FC4